MERTGFIGGSDVASILNLEYGCARKLFLEKRGQLPPNEVTGAMERGTKLEDLIAAEYVERTGNRVQRVNRKIALPAPFDFMQGHIDRKILGDARGPGVLECKSAGEWRFKQFKRDGLPQSHILQMQHYLAITGWAWGAYAVLAPDNWQFQTFEVSRDESLIATIKQAEAKFWAQVENGPAPATLPREDARCGRCSAYWQCHGDVTLPEFDGVVHQDEAPELAAMLDDFEEAQAIMKDAEAHLEGIKARVKDRLGSRAVVETAGRRVYFTPQQRTTWAGEKLAAEYERAVALIEKASAKVPELSLNTFLPVAAFRKATDFKVLRIYKKRS